MIKIGNSNIVGVSLGDTQFSKIYKGVDLVWRKVVGEVDLSSFIIQKGNESPGDIVLWDRDNQQKLIVNVDNVPKFPTSNYVPIGIVAIPSSENKYGDNSGSMMSLKKMSLFEPDNGCVVYKGTWDRYNGYSDNPLYGYTGDTLGTTVTTSTAAQTFFNQSVVNSKIIASSPGYDWKTASQITNSTTKGSYPAGFCCWRYSTEGTSQGDWYLPSSGELYNTFQKNGNIITNVLAKLKEYGFETGNYFVDSSTDGNYRIIACSESRYDQCWYYKATSSLLYGGVLDIYSKVVGLTTITAFCKIDEVGEGGGNVTPTPDPDVTYYDVIINFDSGINSVTIKSSSMNTTVRNSGEVIKVKEGDTITWSVTYKDGYMEGTNCSGSLKVNKNETISITSHVVELPEVLYNKIYYKTNDAQPISLYKNSSLNQNLISNKYDDESEQFVMTFDINIKEIPTSTFYVDILKGYTNLTYISFNNLKKLEKISPNFLQYCTNLQIVDISKLSNVKFIGNSFLEGCKGLQSIDLFPLSQVTTIGNYFLDNCSGLQSIDLSSLSQVTNIGNNFLKGCKGLQSIDLSPLSQVTTIDMYFLADCSGLTQIDLSPLSQVTSIGIYFLSSCLNLKTFIINNPNKVVSLPLEKSNITPNEIFVNDELIEQYKEAVPKFADLFKPLSQYNG